MDMHISRRNTSIGETIAPISRQIWDSKYRFKTNEGVAIDEDIEASWRRVAKALAAAEKDPAAWEPIFYEALEGFRFLPAGRILAGAGTSRRVTLFNCFVMGDIGDSLSSIFDHLREAALTMQQGGGIGYDFSTLRPAGAPVQGVGADASGPLSFMDVWDAMCRTILSAGARRGAMMATMRCDHPDIEDFITAKRAAGRLRNFNLSVLATDPFMAAVVADAEWPLVFDGRVYKTVRAKELFDKITQATFDYAEPGVIFIDRINKRNNLHYCEEIHSTNPCGEQPLPAYGACLLGSINLAMLVRAAFRQEARVDEAELAILVRTAIRMMDNTIAVSGFPLDAQRDEAIAKRRIGLGMTGLADALMMVGLRYGTPEAAAQAKLWAQQIERAAYLTSADLAAEKGAFPLYDEEKYLAGETIRGLEQEVQDAIRKNGIRNALLTSVAPTGTISLVADNVSSGIEPVFALAYTRKVLQKDGSRVSEEVSDHALRKFREIYGDTAPLPDYFVTAQELTPAEHVRMQAAVQQHVDSAISKTVNVPADISFESFQAVYLDAYNSGCKGCTTYRPNDITGSVLEVAAVEKPVETADVLAAAVQIEQVEAAQNQQQQAFDAGLMQRPDKTIGATYKLRWMDSEHALYVTVNDIEMEGRRRPFEVFVNSKNLEHYSWVVGLTRMISAVFRRGGEVAFVAAELKQVFDPRGGQWSRGKYVPSLVAAIGEVLERHMIDSGFLEPAEKPVIAAKSTATALTSTAAASGAPIGQLCSKCSQPGLVREAGCLSCMHCGWSKCG